MTFLRLHSGGNRIVHDMPDMKTKRCCKEASSYATACVNFEGYRYAC